MKKFFILLFAAVMFASCGVVRLEMDSRQSDGSRILMTSDSRLFDDVSVALGAKVKNQKDTILAVLAVYDGRSEHGVFDCGNKMQFRLTDNSVISLSNIYENEFEKGTETYTTQDRVSEYGYAYAYDPYTMSMYVTPYEASTFIPREHTRVTTKSYALYLISKKELEDIITKGVVKLRVETENDELDMLSGTDRVAALLAEEYKCLKEGLATNRVRPEF